MADRRTIPILLVTLSCARPEGTTLQGLRRAARSEGYEAPSPREIEHAKKLFAELFAAEPQGTPGQETGPTERHGAAEQRTPGPAPSGPHPQGASKGVNGEQGGELRTGPAERHGIERASLQAKEIGMELVELAEGDERIAVVREPEGARRGRGFYAFRLGKRSPIAFQAPHSSTDRHTGPIVERLFLEGSGAAAAWSTVSRSTPVQGAGDRADLARLRESFFQAFTHAFAAAHPEGIIVQLHGFDSAAHGIAGTDAVVSDTTRAPRPWISDLASCVAGGIGGKVSVFPRDVDELGGTTNAQGKLLRVLGHRGFLHAEMSLDLRTRLKEDRQLRARFLGCLEARTP